MKLFTRSTTSEYIAYRINNLNNEIVHISDDDILNSDFQEWIVYLCEKYKIEPITLLENNTEQCIMQRKIKVRNQFAEYDSIEPEYCEVDGICITYKIPFEGDAELFFLKPSTTLLLRFDVENLEKNGNEQYGYVIKEFKCIKKDLVEKGDKAKKYVQDEFDREFSNYRLMIDYVNKDIENYNNSLSATTKQLLQSRKDSASSFKSISQILEIPLQRNENSPNTTPIQLKKVPSINRPTIKKTPKEYCISDKDYENINNIIFTSSSSMEKTARTHTSFAEETLRDILLASLNSHYTNVSGETFRKNGKTDINIEFDNKAAYIGECKIWHGEKSFGEAIQQVLNYSTWKDTKVSIIIFNKNIRSFQGIIQKINEWVSANTKRYNNRTANRWSCIYYRSDMNIDIQLEIMAFDLYVEKNNMTQ